MALVRETPDLLRTYPEAPIRVEEHPLAAKNTASTNTRMMPPKLLEEGTAARQAATRAITQGRWTLLPILSAMLGAIKNTEETYNMGHTAIKAQLSSEYSSHAQKIHFR